jgi:hypothetical protein
VTVKLALPVLPAASRTVPVSVRLPVPEVVHGIVIGPRAAVV